VADTGLPWELPYPLPTDLVRDGADAIKDLAEATATGLSAAGNEGIGPNLVLGSTNTTTSTTSTSFVNTSLEVTITPSAASSKVLLIVSLRDLQNGGSSALDSLSDLTLFTPDVTGTNLAGAGNAIVFSRLTGSTGTLNVPTSFSFLHSPSTTSAVTYRLGIRSGNTSTTSQVAGFQQLFAIEVQG